MTAHNLPYVHWLLSPLSKSPIMQFLCTVKAHLLSHKQKPTTKKERKKERKHGSSIDASPCFFVLQHKPVQSYPYYWMGRGGSESQGAGQGGWAFCLGFILDVWRKPVRRWPSLSCSAHHMVKQSEGHWLAAAASVSSTFIAVDV